MLPSIAELPENQPPMPDIIPSQVLQQRDPPKIIRAILPDREKGPYIPATVIPPRSPSPPLLYLTYPPPPQPPQPPRPPSRSQSPILDLTVSPEPPEPPPRSLVPIRPSPAWSSRPPQPRPHLNDQLENIVQRLGDNVHIEEKAQEEDDESKQDEQGYDLGGDSRIKRKRIAPPGDIGGHRPSKRRDLSAWGGLSIAEQEEEERQLRRAHRGVPSHRREHIRYDPRTQRMSINQHRNRHEFFQQAQDNNGGDYEVPHTAYHEIIYAHLPPREMIERGHFPGMAESMRRKASEPTTGYSKWATIGDVMVVTGGARRVKFHMKRGKIIPQRIFKVLATRILDHARTVTNPRLMVRGKRKGKATYRLTVSSEDFKTMTIMKLTQWLRKLFKTSQDVILSQDSVGGLLHNLIEEDRLV